MFLFSAHRLLSKILDDPANFDFDEEDVDEAGGGIWEDHVHVTPAVHGLLAERLQRVLP